jgi:hypothetical protein
MHKVFLRVGNNKQDEIVSPKPGDLIEILLFSMLVISLFVCCTVSRNNLRVCEESVPSDWRLDQIMAYSYAFFVCLLVVWSTGLSGRCPRAIEPRWK